MIISRTPFRISFFGGGTDYPDWYRDNGGQVVGTTIDKYCYIALRRLPPFFTHRHRFVYSRIEMVSQIHEIEHPAIRAVLQEYPPAHGLEVHHDGDVPARSGIGSSSAFTVGLLNALRTLNGISLAAPELAAEAIRIEQTVAREAVGSQDQVWAAHGGLNLVRFGAAGDIDVEPLGLPPERLAALNDRLLLYFTGLTRTASQIAAQQIGNIPRRGAELKEIMGQVDSAVAILRDESCDLGDFGRLLHETWLVKRRLAEAITTDFVDSLYDRARAAGALGGKLLGAGGGGFMLLYVEPEHGEAVRRAMQGILEIPIRINSPGSTIVLNQPDGLGEAPART
ncbi:kinase [Marinibaculum pumilum]|uniref:Kinase n=1 Tax=Marinibaculum pumilum TaxID=1766165 RepID=A0ABV7L2L4_9PROT